MNKIILVNDDKLEIIATVREEFLNENDVFSKKELWKFDVVVRDILNKELYHLCNRISDAIIVEN